MTLADDGILGLSLPDKNNPKSSIFGEAIKQSVFKRPMFTTYLQKCNNTLLCENNGLITFGDFDSKHCVSVHSWLPLIEGSNLWKLKIDGFQVGNKWIDYPVQVIPLPT